MDKTVNLLAYLPGHAGHFISIILSTGEYKFLPNKYPKHENLLNHLSFKDVKWKHGTWESFHRSYSVDPWDGIKEFMVSNKNMYTALFHPSKYHRIIRFCTNELKLLKTNWLLVTLSPELEFINDEFKKRNGNWPRNSSHEEKMYVNIKNWHNPYCINLDNIFKGVDSFVFEYTKLCDHLLIIPNLDVVIPYYKDWYTERKLHRYKL